MFDNIVAGVIATLISGPILALFFFFLRERIFGIPDITGKWHFEMTTVNSDYNPYKGMILRYIVVIWREGSKLSGTVEKVYENSSTGEREYVGDKRSRGDLNGYYELNYLSKDKLYIHIKEQGSGRESTNYFELIRMNNDSLKGAFNSFVANQDGLSEWQRHPF
ncbi:hypothetical protein [Thalassotalea euphylliae]|uniref:hypothetical protein n=1 Tax=Thalassotalea euphylliae TaxID=1655234 RepID=UPI001C6F3B53|nr:hypothetical protein [Thalassotalea euphylliae]